MRYVIAEYAKEREALAYRFYVSDSLYFISQNGRLTQRFYDILHPAPIDPREGDEIAEDIINKLQLRLTNG